MRPLEICLWVFSLGAALALPLSRWRKFGRLLAALAAADLAAHAFFEGAHWQMIPTYLAVAVLCAAAWKRTAAGGRRWSLQILGCGLAGLLIVASAVASYVFPMFRLPKPTGPYPVGTVLLYLKDTSRVEDASPVPGQPRELMVQIWYPAEKSSNRWARYREPRETNLASSYQTEIATNSRWNAPVAAHGAPFPVILFNHGWGSRRTNDTFLTEELASQGYVVASIDHTYNASLVAFPDGRQARSDASDLVGNPETGTPEAVRAVWNKELAKQTADERFVLDRLQAMSREPGSMWFGRMNTQLTGAMGHSFGGAAATNLCAVDPRVHAAINMDGWFFGAIQARGANQPLLFMDTSFDANGWPPDPAAKVSTELDKEDAADLANSVHRFGGYVVTLRGVFHEDFTDQGLVSPLRKYSHSGFVPAPEVEAIVRAYVVAFFAKTLRGQDPAILRERSGPFPEATLASWPGGTPVAQGGSTVR